MPPIRSDDTGDARASAVTTAAAKLCAIFNKFFDDFTMKGCARIAAAIAAAAGMLAIAGENGRSRNSDKFPLALVFP